jgi:hypothetical protein
MAHASQGQVAAAHQTLGSGEEMTDLHAQLAVGRPASLHGLCTEQCFGDVAVPGAGLRRIERLQGMQMQQARASGGPESGWRRFTMDHAGLYLVFERRHAGVGIDPIGCAVPLFNGKRCAQTMRGILCGEDQLHSRMHKALAARNSPEMEGMVGCRAVRASGTHMHQILRPAHPERMHIARVKGGIFGNIATPSEAPRHGGPRPQPNPRDMTDGAAGTPKPARNRPGPANRDKRRQRARAYGAHLGRDESSWRQVATNQRIACSLSCIGLSPEKRHGLINR